MNFVSSWGLAVWAMLVDSAAFFLLGLVLAGLIRAWFDETRVARFLGNNSFGSVLKAALLGVPLPLCSCSVLPVATQLRRSGVSKAGTVSFLISTPESGVDSILLTYSLTDPLMTIARPLAAFLSAAAAGSIEVAVGDRAGGEVPAVMSHCHDCGPVEPQAVSRLGRVLEGQKHAFTDMISDLAPYLLVGYVLAGLVSVLLGDPGTLPEGFRTGWAAYVGALAVGLPLYICATSSTPLAAVMLAAGISPGAILVFLLVGPATNLASLAVLKKILGLATTLRYLIVLTVMAVLCGIVLDWLYGAAAVTPRYMLGDQSEGEGWLYVASALATGGLIVFYSVRAGLRQVHRH